MVIIRKASLYDTKGIADVINSVIAEGGLTTLDKPFTAQEEEQYMASLSDREAIFVAEAGGEIVGVQTIALFSSMKVNSHVATIGTWVNKEHRGKGVGKLLAQKTFSFARKKGFERSA